MRKLLLSLSLLVLLTGCRGCYADFNERRASVQKTCPGCTFVLSEGFYVAVDTNKQPNIVYHVYFKEGGVYYKASDIDHLVRVN